jgi:DNA mismatch repair protein MutS2
MPVLPRTSDNTVDLRGMRVEEAVDRVEMFLDSALLQGIDGVYIIHGHGTGALKRGVRGYLTGSRYVRDFRPGNRDEGGDGVTVAYLRDEVR